MGPQELVKQKEQAKQAMTGMTYQDKQKAAWEMTDSFRQKAKLENSALAVKYEEYNNLDMVGILNALNEDTGSKSDSYNDMVNALGRLLGLAATDGKYTDDEANGLTADFYETMFYAQHYVQHYLATHAGHRGTSKGERRVQLVLRMNNLLGDLKKQVSHIEEAQPEERQRRIAYAKEGLTESEIKVREANRTEELRMQDLERLIDTGVYGEKFVAKDEGEKKEQQKARKQWLIGGYTQDLKELLQGTDVGKNLESRDDFIAFLEKQNNCLVANQVAVTLLVDAAHDVTLDMPWIKDDLRRYILRCVTKDDMLNKPEKFADIARVKIDEFKERYGSDIEKTAEKSRRIKEALHIPKDDTGIYQHPAIRQMLAESDDKDFEQQAESLKAKVRQTDPLIKQMIAGRFSPVTRGLVEAKLVQNLGSLRIFGSKEQILDQAALFMDMTKYTVPDVYITENIIKNVMHDLGIESSRRDHFIEHITNGQIGVMNDKALHADFWKVRGEGYASNVKANNKSFAKRVNKKGVYLTKAQWDEIEKLNLESGSYANAAFKELLETLLNENEEGEKISRNEYVLGVKFNDAQKEPARLARVEREKEKIHAYGDKLSSRFLVMLAGAQGDIYAPYRSLDEAYTGAKGIKEKRTAEWALYRERSAEIINALKIKNFSKEQQDLFIEKYGFIFKNMLDITEDMNDDEKLRVRRFNLERFGAETWEDARKLIWLNAIPLAQGSKDEASEEAKERYESRMQLLKSYEGGKYAEIAELLLTVPDIYAAMMSEDEKDFEAFLKNEIDVRLGGFMEGIAKAGVARTEEQKKKDKNKSVYVIPAAVRKQYAYTYLRRIYEGKLTGDGDFFSKQLIDYEKKLMEVRPAGGHSIDENISAAMKEVEEKMTSLSVRSDETTGLRLAVFGRIYNLMNDTASFLTLLDRDKLKEFARAALQEAVSGTETDKESRDVAKTIKDIKENAVKKALPEGADEEEYVLLDVNEAYADIMSKEKKEKEDRWKKIAEIKRTGHEKRRELLGVDNQTVDTILVNKSMIRVQDRDENLVHLKQSKANDMRGFIAKNCSDLELPASLIDALVEEGASDSIKERLTGTMWRGSLLYKHALAMFTMYDFLRRPGSDGDAPMSDEEAQMFIVNCYGQRHLRASIFENKEGIHVDAIRKSDNYRLFRESYRKLRELESEAADEISLDYELQGMSRDLRTILLTNVGLTTTGGKNQARFNIQSAEGLARHHERLGEIIEQNRKYFVYSREVTKVIREEMENYYNSRKRSYSVAYRERQLHAIREYFLGDVTEAVKAGKEFNEAEWKKKLTDFYADALLRDTIEFQKDSLSDKNLAGADNLRMDTDAGSSLLETAIRDTTIFTGKNNKYDKLSEDEKKMFAVALMLMDKGAVGMGSEGTAGLLQMKDKKQARIDQITAEIDKYVAGKEYHINIDYKEALSKLINYGEGIPFVTDWYTLSETAYEKAMQFAKALSAKRAQYGEKDVKRLSDGYSSINAAFVKFNKPQQQEVDRLREVPLSKAGVLEKMKAYISADKNGLMDQIKSSAKKLAIPVAQMKYVVSGMKQYDEYLRMKEIEKRFSEMTEQELTVFIRLMQERTVIDKSTAGGGAFADNEKHVALFEALSSDSVARSEALKGFDDEASCLQALTTALSFQLKDNANFLGKDLGRGYFANGALDRKTLVDWKLIENVFAFMDEIKEKQLEQKVHANAHELIDQAGNEEAKKAWHELQDKYKEKKEDFKAENFEAWIDKYADEDARADVDIAIAGFKALSDKEKALFFKVLARRDYLDISKKNFKSNFFGFGDRDYMNMAGRTQLIDEYVNANLNDNIGLQLDGDAYYKAMQSLFSTQVSDRVNLSKAKDAGDIFANERFLFFGRGTAIDWKLFKRALNFVNRASEELEYVEGNANLYRGAGELSKYGHLNMDYSFLRKNFHQTGNQWGRYLGRIFAKKAADELKIDDKLEKIVSAAGMADKILKLTGFKEDGTFRKGVAWVKDNTAKIKENVKKAGEDPAQYHIEEMKIAKKEKTQEEKDKAKQKEAERRENLLYYDHLKEGMDGIIAQSKDAEKAMKDVVLYLRDNFATKFESTKFLTATQGAAPKQDEKNLVNKVTKGAAKDNTYGDFRDIPNDVKEWVEDKTKPVKQVYDIGMQVSFVKDLKELGQLAAEKIAYRFLNDSLLHAEIDVSKEKPEDRDKKELEAIKKAADKYAKDMFEGIVKDVIGEETANKLLDYENGYYSIKTAIGDTMKSITGGIAYAKKCVAHVQNISSCLENGELLTAGEKKAMLHREEDDRKLEKASQNRLDEAETAKVEAIVNKHRGLSGMSKEIAQNLQYFKMSEELLNFTFETIEMAGGKLNVGQEAVAKAIKQGIEFAMFAIRVATDTRALGKYYTKTDAGKAVVKKLQKGFEAAGRVKTLPGDKEKHQEYLNDLTDENSPITVAGMVAQAKGYENTQELVENTGMSMAQSIVFCASNFNPMAETRLMAITVMSVLGMEKEIGSVSPETVEKLFMKFQMKR